MKIKTLSENTSISEEIGHEHGLSLYIETKKHKLLFDTGGNDLFAKNAQKMGVDIKEIDTVIISHGHYDHGGGLKTFLEVNSKAVIFLQEKAFDEHFANRSSGVKGYIGLDINLLPNERFHFVDKELQIDDELFLFSHVQGDQFIPAGNQDLFMIEDQELVPDNFVHEQNLLINEDQKKVLIAGCAHRGIVNILEHILREKSIEPDVVIGGFHLYNRASDQSEDPELVNGIAKALLEHKGKFYTCHCTGIKSYQLLKTIMIDRLDYLSAGSEILI